MLARTKPRREILEGVARPALALLDKLPSQQKKQAMIDLYYWTTPNGHKITIFLEEAAIAYRIVPVNISRGEQFKPEFLAISPNNRMPRPSFRIDADQADQADLVC